VFSQTVGQRQKKAEKSGVVAFRGGDGGTREIKRVSKCARKKLVKK